MNILIISAHPAQVHGFKLVREELMKAGHKVFWATTDKDIAINLLQQLGIEYFLILKAPKNFVSRVWYMLRNIFRLIPYLRRNKIDMVVDRYEPFISVAAWLNRTPHICLADTEHAAIKCKPFIQMCQAALYPTCFYEHVTDDMLYFPGNIELFYLHPKRFTPKPVWDLLGIEPNTRFAIVRFVKWDAWHDIQLVGGFTLEQKRELIARLCKHLRVFISSESELPADLEQYRIQIPIERMHDVQAAAALFVGESATMASESVVLGTPAVYIDEVGRGYTDEEAREGLLWMFRPVPNRKALKECEPSWISGGVEECIARAEEIGSPDFDTASYAKRHQAWLSAKIDCTAFLTWFIEQYPKSIEEVRNADAAFWEAIQVGPVQARKFVIMKRMMKKIYLVLAVVMLAGCGMQSRQDEGTMDYPRAEWDRAGVILMHTPGQELFDGVIHPSAGLFEHYFDVDKAAEEHRGYIRLLEANGIRVHTIAGILNEVSIDTLRTLAGQEMLYDISAMPDADRDATEAYRQTVLAQMSRADLIRCILLRPVVRLFPTDNNTGVAAEYIHDPLMNLYFTRDQSITTPRGHILCRMNSPQRAPETDVIELCYRHLGVAPILRIEGEGRLEGGDYIPAGTIALIGCGMRTNEEGIRQIMEADAFGHDTVVVVHDHKRWQMQMHLDTHFNIIDRDLCTMVGSRLNAKPGEPEFTTCDIYVRAPGTKPYRLEQREVPFVAYLQGRGFEIIPIDEADEMHYANNYLTIAPRHIMAVAGQSEAFEQRLATAGVTVEWVPLESLIDGYGAAHCMTQVMKRVNE